MWNKFAGIILRNRALLLIIIGLFSAYMFYESTRVKLSYEYATLLPKSSKEYKEYNYFKKTFGEEANVFIIGIKDISFFTLKKFNEYRQINEKIKKIDGITAIMSVPDLYVIKKDITKKQFVVKSLFPDTVKTQQELDSLKHLVFNLPFYKSFIFNDTAKVYLTAITFQKKLVDSKERIAVIDDIVKMYDDWGNKYGLTIHYSGLPYIRTAISEKIEREMKIFVVLAFLVTIIILYIFFRSLKVIGFASIVVFLSLIWTLGFMGIFGYKITMVTAMLPPLIIVIGIPNTIYLLNHYFLEFKTHSNKIKALQRTISRTGNAIFLTNLTTATGFGTFVITNSKILKEFGVIATLSILGLFLLTLIIIPTMYSFSPSPSSKHFRHLDSKFSKVFMNFVTMTFTRGRKVLYITVTIVAVAAIIGLAKIKILGYMVDDIPHHDKVYVDLKFFEKYFKGVLPIEIMIDTQKKKGLLKPSVMKKIDKLQKRFEEYPELSRPLSYIELIKFTKQAYYNLNPKKYSLPKGMERNFILSYVKKAKDSRGIMKSFIDSTKSKARISVEVADIGTIKMKELVKKMQADVDSVFPPEKYKSILTGISIIYMEGMHYLVNNLIWSVILAIVLIAIFMSLLFGSLRMVLISLVPNLLPLIITAGVMGFAGIPLKPSTILVFSIAFGISVDDTIHFLSRYRLELKNNDWEIGKSVLEAMKHVGISMFHTSIVLFFGFFIFVFSDFGGTVALGLLVSMTLIVAMITNLLLLPSLLMSLERYITTRAFAEPLLSIFDEEEDIDIDQLN
jgi:hydrophobe/amphiphile efflux-3 (HAE3) family protein